MYFIFKSSICRQWSTAATEARAPNKLVCNRIDGIFDISSGRDGDVSKAGVRKRTKLQATNRGR